MADFRRWLFALGALTLLAGFSVPVRAQNPQSLNCSISSQVPTVRQEGFTELVGDITLTCQGGIPTAAGQAVPQVDISVFLSQNVTSKITATLSTTGGTVNFNEALLMFDEPHSNTHPTVDLLNCGNVGAPDLGVSGAGVCSIISDGVPADTYNGVPNAFGTSRCSGDGTPAANSYGCGRPNVFQGRQGSNLVYSPNNSVTFAGVPFDPPGSTGFRTIRITNIRVNANGQGVPNGLFLAPITAQISINGNSNLGINNNTYTATVAFVQPGLLTPTGTGTGAQFLQCVAETNATTGTTLTFTEGFYTSWKPRNISFLLNQTVGTVTGNGTITNVANTFWSWNAAANSNFGSFNAPGDLNQNVPGVNYYTESGFEYPSLGGSNATTAPNAALSDPAEPNNPPFGVGSGAPVTSALHALYNAYKATGISAAGSATQGTRLVLKVNNIPTNTTITIPNQIPLINQAGNQSGGAVLVTGTNANGAGGTLVTTNIGGTTAVQANNLVIYEIIFADPFSLESLSVPFQVSYANAPASALAQTGLTATVTGAGFAPFYASGAQFAATTSAFPIPRFVPGTGPTLNLFTINKCTCNILFPFVISTAGFDTGLAIANTSADPGNSAGYANGAGAQTGSLTLWMYGSNSAGASAAAISPQCTNAASPGTCPNGPGSGPTNIPAGQVLLYAMSGNNTAYIGGNPSNLAGLDNRWAGYIGYMIAQTQFQYCHAYAFISSPGLSNNVSEGYLGLILDNNGINCEGALQGSLNANTVLGICRTGQQGESLAH